MFCVKPGGSLAHWLSINSPEAYASPESRRACAPSSPRVTVSRVPQLSGLIQTHFDSLNYKKKKKNLHYLFELGYFSWEEGSAWSGREGGAVALHTHVQTLPVGCVCGVSRRKPPRAILPPRSGPQPTSHAAGRLLREVHKETLCLPSGFMNIPSFPGKS